MEKSIKIFLAIFSVLLLGSSQTFANDKSTYNPNDYKLMQKLEEKFSDTEIEKKYQDFKREVYIVDLINRVDPNFKATIKQWEKNLSWLKSNHDRLIKIHKTYVKNVNSNINENEIFVYFDDIYKYIEKYEYIKLKNGKTKNKFEIEKELSKIHKINENNKWDLDTPLSFQWKNEIYIAYLINSIEPKTKATRTSFNKNLIWLKTNYKILIELSQKNTEKYYIDFVEIHKYIEETEDAVDIEYQKKLKSGELNKNYKSSKNSAIKHPIQNTTEKSLLLIPLSTINTTIQNINIGVKIVQTLYHKLFLQ